MAQSREGLERPRGNGSWGHQTTCGNTLDLTKICLAFRKICSFVCFFWAVFWCTTLNILTYRLLMLNIEKRFSDGSFPCMTSPHLKLNKKRTFNIYVLWIVVVFFWMFHLRFLLLFPCWNAKARDLGHLGFAFGTGSIGSNVTGSWML